METAKYNLTIKAGATYTKEFTLTDANGAPLNLTGYTAHAQIRTAHNGELLASFGTSTGGATGKFTLSLTAAQTLALASMSGVYDVMLVSSGNTLCPVEGQVEILPSITVVP